MTIFGSFVLKTAALGKLNVNTNEHYYVDDRSLQHTAHLFGTVVLRMTPARQMGTTVWLDGSDCIAGYVCVY